MSKKKNTPEVWRPVENILMKHWGKMVQEFEETILRSPPDYSEYNMPSKAASELEFWSLYHQKNIQQTVRTMKDIAKVIDAGIYSSATDTEDDREVQSLVDQAYEAAGVKRG